MVKQINARTHKTLQKRVNKFMDTLGELPNPPEKYTRKYLTLDLKDNTQRFYCRIEYQCDKRGYEA